MADIVTAIFKSAVAGGAHRDITPNDFGHKEGRGILYDHPAGKVRAGHCNVVCWHETQNLWPSAYPCEHRTSAMLLQGTHAPC